MSTATLSDVQAVYSGPEGRLWELLMGEQIHIGGFRSSMDLANRANIAPDSTGVDLCCCTGAGMRFLVRYRKVARMVGVDATPRMVELGRRRAEAEGVAERIGFVEGEATETGLPDGAADFVWGEDAWCYVEDKPALIAEAARLVKPGGTIAFTDWVWGPIESTDEEREHLLEFMKFPNVLDIPGYVELLNESGCRVLHAADTGRFADCLDLYIRMVELQHTGDALRILGHDFEVLKGLAAEMAFMQSFVRQDKMVQGLFIARKGDAGN